MDIRKHKSNSGFTIVELLVVIIVIGILATITIIAFTGISQRAVIASMESDMSNASKKLELFKTEKSDYPIFNDCTIPEDNQNICLATSPGNSLSYNRSVDGKTFSLNIKNTNGTEYTVANNSTPTLISNNYYSTPIASFDNSIFNTPASKVNKTENGVGSGNAIIGLENDCGYNGGDCLTIQGANNSVSYFEYTKTGLSPNTPYVIEAYIKGSDISNAGYGAQISGLAWDSSNIDNKGTFDYKKCQYTAISDRNGNLTFRLRLGYYYNVTPVGKAYFDDIKILPYNNLIFSSNHIRFFVGSNQISGINNSVINKWLSNLDRYIDNLCYITTTSCTGLGYDIIGLNTHQGYYAEATNNMPNAFFKSIFWSRESHPSTHIPYIYGLLDTIRGNNKEMGFGIMHEIGHKFINAKWSWNGELWANMDMALGLYNMEYGFINNGNTYVGKNISGNPNYKLINENYCSNINCIITSPDTFNSYLIRIQQDLGIETFRKTFDYFKTISEPPTADEKLTAFVNKLFEIYNSTVPVDQQKYRSDYFTDTNWNNALNAF